MADILKPVQQVVAGFLICVFISCSDTNEVPFPEEQLTLPQPVSQKLVLDNPRQLTWDTIKSGGIWYKKAEVYAVSVNMFGNTAILLNDIDLVAEVGGREVTNPFMVTEVYIKENDKWKMGSLTFSHLMRPVKLK